MGGGGDYRGDDRDGGDRAKKQSLLVRNLNIRTSIEKLRDIFDKFGEVRGSVSVVSIALPSPMDRPISHSVSQTPPAHFALQVRDIYMPRDHYTREPRGFAFIEFLDERDARDAMEGMDKREIEGREVNSPELPRQQKTPMISVSSSTTTTAAALLGKTRILSMVESLPAGDLRVRAREAQDTE